MEEGSASKHEDNNIDNLSIKEWFSFEEEIDSSEGEKHRNSNCNSTNRER